MSAIPYLQGALVTGIFTALAALGGVWVTQRHAVMIAREQRTEHRRAVLRAELNTLVVEVRSLLGDAPVQVLFFSQASRNDILEYVDTDMGREGQRRGRQIQASLATLTLTAGDPAVLRALAVLSQHIDSWADRVTQPSMNAKGKSEDEISRARRQGYAEAAATRKVLDELISVAAPLVRIPVEQPHWPSRPKRLRKRLGIRRPF